MQRSATARHATGLRVLAEQRARELGYASVEAMLETAYAIDRPWTEVAAELGVCRVDSISKWARKLGMVRGEGWYMERRAHRAQRAASAFATPIGRAALDPTPGRRLTPLEALEIAMQRAAARVTTPAGQRAALRSLAACQASRCPQLDPTSDVLLALTPEEEAEYAARHTCAWQENRP
jgi:hypothetical protein